MQQHTRIRTVLHNHARIRRRGQRVTGPRLKKCKNIGLLSNPGSDRLKFTKPPSQHSILGHHQHAWQVEWWPLYSGIWIHPPSSLPSSKKKNTSKLNLLWQVILDLRMTIFNYRNVKLFEYFLLVTLKMENGLSNELGAKICRSRMGFTLTIATK